MFARLKQVLLYFCLLLADSTLWTAQRRQNIGVSITFDLVLPSTFCTIETL